MFAFRQKSTGLFVYIGNAGVKFLPLNSSPEEMGTLLAPIDMVSVTNMQEYFKLNDDYEIVEIIMKLVITSEMSRDFEEKYFVHSYPDDSNKKEWETWKIYHYVIEN